MQQKRERDWPIHSTGKYISAIHLCKVHTPLKTCLRWVPNANEINTKKHEMYMANARNLCLGHNATYIPLTFRFGVRGNSNFCVFRYRHVGIGNAKSLRWGSNARPQRQWFCVAVEYRLKCLQAFKKGHIYIIIPKGKRDTWNIKLRLFLSLLHVFMFLPNVVTPYRAMSIWE